MKVVPKITGVIFSVTRQEGRGPPRGGGKRVEAVGKDRKSEEGAAAGGGMGRGSSSRSAGLGAGLPAAERGGSEREPRWRKD